MFNKFIIIQNSNDLEFFKIIGSMRLFDILLKWSKPLLLLWFELIRNINIQELQLINLQNEIIWMLYGKKLCSFMKMLIFAIIIQKKQQEFAKIISFRKRLSLELYESMKSSNSIDSWTCQKIIIHDISAGDKIITSKINNLIDTSNCLV